MSQTPTNNDTTPDAAGAFDPEDDAVIALFSEYYEGGLGAEKEAEFKARLESQPEFAKAYGDFEKTMELLSGMHKMSAPIDFDKKVEGTIHRRSGGRFFGRKAFGDRIPFELLAVVVLLLAGLLYWMGRTSDSGGHKVNSDSAPSLRPESP